MKKLFSLLLIAFIVSSTSASQAFSWSDFKESVGEIFSKHKPLTNDEVIRGLKEALSIGSKNSARNAAKENGYYKNRLLFIPFPPDAIKVKETAEKLGLQRQVDQFVVTLNRAAEEAAKKAAPIFLDAIKDMSIRDGFKILDGLDNAATTYLKTKTSRRLQSTYEPIVHKAIEKVQVTKYWNPIVSKYNALPGTNPVNPDLDAYVTERAIHGLFLLVAQEEKKIRREPSARVTELLRRVFGADR